MRILSGCFGTLGNLPMLKVCLKARPSESNHASISYIGINMTLANEIEELFKEIYFTDQYELEERILEREYKFKSVIYIMTHLIINKSNYYKPKA